MSSGQEEAAKEEAKKKLFEKCKFFLGREVPRDVLVFTIRRAFFHESATYVLRRVSTYISLGRLEAKSRGSARTVWGLVTQKATRQ